MTSVAGTVRNATPPTGGVQVVRLPREALPVHALQCRRMQGTAGQDEAASVELARPPARIRSSPDSDEHRTHIDAPARAGEVVLDHDTK